MKFAKSQGGLHGIFNMYPSYQRFCRTTSVRAKFFEQMLEQCGMLDDAESSTGSVHRENFKSEIKRSEEDVNRTIDAIMSFSNPFTQPDKARLYCISSGAPVSIDVQIDVMRAEEAGAEAKRTFVEKRLESQVVPFFDPIKRLNLRTMENNHKKVPLTSSKGRLIEYQDQGNLAFQLLVKSQHLDTPINLEELMSYQVTAVPQTFKYTRWISGKNE